MSKELAKTYDPKGIEDRLYKKWMDNGYFHAKVNPDKKPFTIVMPPPNVTGQLHMGHALDETMQDILIRFKRMQGYEALWQPGTDHAAIATEVKVTEKLRKEGIDKNEIGREEFMKHAWAWKEEYGGKIINQLKKLGASADWERERFTMDEGCSKAVQEVFIRLYEKGYIYKGSRIINWCPVCQTSISDAEVVHEDQDGYFWHINYPIVGEEGRFVEIATTRPETLLGDTAVAVNPEDERYKDLVGKMLKLPLTDREIPVIADEYVDKEFGTGCVKITPAHDPNDFEVGRRHNLEEINILNDDATINSLGGKYAGMDRYEARKAMVEDLKEQGLLVKVVPHSHSVGTHDRCGTTVEPMIKPQWFVKMADMAAAASEAEKNGEVNFIPDRFSKIYQNWLNNIHDWCISRQRNWGVPLPFLIHKKTGKLHPETMKILNKVADVVEKEGIEAWTRLTPTELTDLEPEMYEKSKDTLDVWFDSGTTHMTVMRGSHADKLTYPADLYLEGSDQHRGWFHSSLLTGCAIDGRAPYKGLLTHGFTVDEQGRKMSKSLGNVIAPSEINDKYGAEILRLWVASSDYTGEISLGEKILKGTVDAYRRFRNTIRFLLANTSDFDIKKDAVPVEEMVELDRWAIARMKSLQEEILDKYDHYQFHTAYAALQLFASGDLGGFYLDILKDRLYTTAPDSAARRSAQTALWYITDALLKLLAPALSFTAEEAYAVFNPENKGTIFVERYAELPNVKEGVELLNKWSIIRDLRSNVQMEIERQREKGLIGSSLQAEVSLKLPQEEYDLIKGLGDEAAFVMITSKVTLDGVSPERVITVKPSEAKKCERCWQYKESVGEDKNYPTLCCRCVGNLFGTPETRRFA